MKSLYSLLWVILIFTGSSAAAQTVTGKWYGTGNADINASDNNYLVELILQQKGGKITGEFNYYFKSGFFPSKITGTYDSKTRKLVLKTMPVTYYRSAAVNGVECTMNGEFTLLVSKAGSALKGRFSSTAFYALTCPDIIMNLTPSKDEETKQETVVDEEKDLGIKEEQDIKNNIAVVPVAFKEQTSAEKLFIQRKNVDMGLLEVDSTNLTIQLIDNGEIDKDSVSVFFNNHLLANKIELTKRSLNYNISLDLNRSINELSMFAENLGMIPPNTALLVVYDGKKRHEINLTSTLQTNGTIRLKKKDSLATR